VLVLRPNPRGELQRQRGGTAGAGLVSAYHRHRADVYVLEDPTPSRVWEYCRSLGQTGVDLVHLCGTPRKAGGSIVLDFGSRVTPRAVEKGQASSPELSVTSTGELLSALTRDIVAPSVILETPLPRTPGESARALLARNNFAYQLLRLGRLPAVLATGLTRPEHRLELFELIARGLTSGASLPQIAKEIAGRSRAERPDLRTEMPSTTTTALFLQRPPCTLLPLTFA
jgi:hypothetical protein